MATFLGLLMLSAAVLSVLGAILAKLRDGDMPWLVVAALLTTSGLVLHKKLVHSTVGGRRTRMRAFLFAVLAYLAPAAVCWTTAVVVVTRTMLPSLGGIWAQFIVLAGVFELAHLLVHKELLDLRQPA